MNSLNFSVGVTDSEDNPSWMCLQHVWHVAPSLLETTLSTTDYDRQGRLLNRLAEDYLVIQGQEFRCSMIVGPYLEG